MRAVLDVNVLISALISRRGGPAALLVRWLKGEFEVVVSDKLLSELSRALAYPKLRGRVDEAEASAFIQLLRATALGADDPPAAPRRSRDRGDDYLVALAESTAAVVVSGDRDLLALGPKLPVLSPTDFLAQLAAEGENTNDIE